MLPAVIATVSTTDLTTLSAAAITFATTVPTKCSRIAWSLPEALAPKTLGYSPLHWVAEVDLPGDLPLEKSCIFDIDVYTYHRLISKITKVPIYAFRNATES